MLLLSVSPKNIDQPRTKKETPEKTEMYLRIALHFTPSCLLFLRVNFKEPGMQPKKTIAM